MRGARHAESCPAFRLSLMDVLRGASFGFYFWKWPARGLSVQLTSAVFISEVDFFWSVIYDSGQSSLISQWTFFRGVSWRGVVSKVLRTLFLQRRFSASVGSAAERSDDNIPDKANSNQSHFIQVAPISPNNLSSMKLKTPHIKKTVISSPPVIVKKTRCSPICLRLLPRELKWEGSRMSHAVDVPRFVRVTCQQPCPVSSRWDGWFLKTRE